MERTIKRGDIYYAKLNPVVGSEQGGKRRPVLIISNNKGNKHSTTVIVAAITGKEHAKPNLPTHVIVNDCECLEKDSIIPVSYTHLDVYKRQDQRRAEFLSEAQL